MVASAPRSGLPWPWLLSSTYLVLEVQASSSISGLRMRISPSKDPARADLKIDGSLTIENRRRKPGTESVFPREMWSIASFRCGVECQDSCTIAGHPRAQTPVEPWVSGGDQTHRQRELQQQSAGRGFWRQYPIGLSKIGVEYVAAKNRMHISSDVAETCLAMKRELDALPARNQLLKEDGVEIRSEIIAGKNSSIQKTMNSPE